MQEINKILINWLKNEVTKNNANGIVFEIAPKLESAVIAAIAKHAFPNNSLGLVLPYMENEENDHITSKIIQTYGLPTKSANLDSVLNELLSKLEGPGFRFPPPWDFFAAHNVAPRLRNASLYYFANKLNYIVVGNLNKLHICLGLFTKFGSGAADILPLGDMYYYQIESLAKDLNVPDEIISFNFQSDQWIGQSKDSEFGLTKHDLDNIMQCIDQNDTSECDNRILKLIREKNRSVSHKRKMPKIFKLEIDNLDMSHDMYNV